MCVCVCVCVVFFRLERMPRHWVVGVKLFETAWWPDLQWSQCSIELDISTLEGETITLARNVVHQSPNDVSPNTGRTKTASIV
jgi:hypothetical protein